MSKFITIDIEGDALCRSINQKLFPEPPHYDPNTRIWCVSVCTGSKPYTYVCKLPETTRILPGGMMTKAYHEANTKIPYELDGNHITGFETYTGLLSNICVLLCRAYQSGIKVYFRGYGKYDYDYDMLKRIFQEHELPTDVLKCMVNFNKVHTGYVWENTAEQVKTGQWISNQQYMINGIRHNMQDSIQLYNIIRNYYAARN